MGFRGGRFSRAVKPAEKDHRPLDGPVGPEAADRVARQRFNPARPADFEDFERPGQGQGRKNKHELAQFDPDIEKEQRQRNFGLRQAGGRKSAGKTEPVQEAEQEGHDPGIADGQARLPSPGADDLGSEEQDAQRDGRIERRQRHTGVPQGGDAEGDAVGQGEGGDRLQQHHPALDDQQQPQDKE